MSWSEGGQCLQLIQRNGAGAVRVSVREAAKLSRHRVSITVTAEASELDNETFDRLTDDVRWMLGLDIDLTEFYELCSDHPSLKLLPGLGAGRIPRSISLSENIVKALCATNVNWTQAVKMINRIGQLGPPVRHFVHLTAWPTPREILRAGHDYLSDVCRLGYRVDSILRFCRDVCDGKFNASALRQAAADPNTSSDEILTHIRSIQGIGPSSAHYLLTALGRYDRLAIDSATIAHVARTHTNGRKPSLRQIEKIYAPFGRWKNLACWFEFWLTWGTAARMMEKAGLDVPRKPRSR